jgi:DNA-binding CsgD family transcriptional regulator
MPAEFAVHFGVEFDSPGAQYPPFPWWPAEHREVMQTCFEFAVSDGGAAFEGVQFVGEFRVASGCTDSFLLRLEKLPDGTTAIYAERYAPPEQYQEVAVKAMELGRLATLLVSEAPTAAISHGLASLSPRERTVTDLLTQGKRIDGIAQELHISIHTARNHRKAIFAKLGVRSHVELLTKLDAPGVPPHG